MISHHLLIIIMAEAIYILWGEILMKKISFDEFLRLRKLIHRNARPLWMIQSAA